MATQTNNPTNYQSPTSKFAESEPLEDWSSRIVNRVKGTWQKFSIDLSSKEWAENFEGMSRRYSRTKVEQVISKAQTLKWKDGMPEIGDLWDLCTQTTEDVPNGKHLYDDPCQFGCMNGWREQSWEELTPQRKNKTIETYGSLEAAKKEKFVARCECWRGPRASKD